MKLNIGSGYRSFDEYLNIDNDPNTNPDYLVDIEKDQLPFNDSSVSDVKAYHILEHLGEGFFHFLKELYRVCEDGAVIEIQVPHHRSDYFYNDFTHKRPITLDGLRMLSKTYNDFCQENDEHTSALGYQLDVNFEIIWYDVKYNVNYYPLLDEVRKNPEKTKILEQILSECNNVIDEVYVKLMVVK